MNQEIGKRDIDVWPIWKICPHYGGRTNLVGLSFDYIPCAPIGMNLDGSLDQRNPPGFPIGHVFGCDKKGEADTE